MNIDSIINKLSKKSTTRIESLHLLKSLKKEIRDKSASRILSLDDIKQIFQKILEDTELTDCPTYIVRLYLASCFSDAFYIFVPNIPLSTTGQLDAVFQLFSTVIPIKYQEESTEYNIIQSIIDVLNITDSYYLIANRDVSYEIIESIIKMKPVSSLNDRYDSNFQSAIKFIVNLINVSTSDFILSEIERLFSVNFNSSLIVQKVLPLLSQNQQMSIIGSFQQHLNYNDFMKAFVTATKILKMPFGFVIQSLYPELINEDDSQRMAVFTLVNEIFYHKRSELSTITDQNDDNDDASEDVKSINFILSRNVDKCPKIRLIIIQIASYFVESKNQTFFDKALNVIKSVHYDPNEGVRFTGLDIVWRLQKQNLLYDANDENTENDINIFLNDKSHRIREKALMYMCESVKLKKENSDLDQSKEGKNTNTDCLDIIITYCFDKPGTEIFMAFSILFDSFDSTELYGMTTEKNKYMKVLNFIKTTNEYVKKYVETGNLSSNNLIKLLTKEIWKPFVPNKKLLQIRKKYKTQDAIQVILKITNEQFAKEFVALSIEVPVDYEKLILKCNDKAMIKNFARFSPKQFCFYLPKILAQCNKECVSILPFIFEYIFPDPKNVSDDNVCKMAEILNSLISAGTPDSLIAFSKLLSKWNSNFTTAKKKIFTVTKENERIFFKYDKDQKEIDYQKFGTTFSLKFFFFLAIPDLMPNFFFKTSKKIDQNDPPLFDKQKESQDKPLVTRFSYFLSPSKSFICHQKSRSNYEDDQIDNHYVKWSLRISTLFKENEMIRIHFHFLESFPLQCLESLFRISNVISNDFAFSILLPYKSANDISRHFKDAQKKGSNLLNLISAEKFRRIASLLVDSKDDDGFSITKSYSKLNDKYWILSMIDEALKNPKTPIEFLSLIVLGLAFEENDSLLSSNHINFNDLRRKIYEKAQKALAYHVSLRRKFAYQNDSSSSPLSSQSTLDANDDQSVDFNSNKKSKKRNSLKTINKSSSNDQSQDDKFIKPSQSNSLLSGQQVELIVPSLFNVLAFLYFDQNLSVNFKVIIDQLFDMIITNDKQKCMIFCAINEVKNAINSQSSFGKKMKVICEYAASKINVRIAISPQNFHINQKFVKDDGNEF